MAKVICSICGKETSKRKTYAIGGGKRACREHEGVTEKGEQRKEQEKRRILNQKEDEQKRRKEFFKGKPTKFSNKPSCWVCEKEGIKAQEFFMQRLVDSEKHSLLHGVTNPFTDPDHPLSTRRADQPVIFTATKEAMGDHWKKAYKKAKRDFKQLMDLAGFMGICANCAVKIGFNPLPEVTPEQMKAMMPITEAIRPALREEAMRQMGRDN